MKKQEILRKRRASVSNQLRQLLWGTQISALGFIINIILFGENLFESANALYFRLDLLVLACGVILTSLLLVILNRGQYRLAVTLFFLLWSVVMAFITWFGGGLYSPFILSYPIILLLAALFTDRISYIAVYFILCLAIVLIGFNHIYDWFPTPESSIIEGIPKIIGTLSLTTLSGYVCWTFGSVVRGSFKNLRLENRQVIESQEVIKKMAETDPLTNLLNRSGAESRYRTLLEKLNFSQECIVVYYIDLDNFKNINNLFDHYAGDQLLKTMGERLTTLLGDDDFACRFGGDEFVLVVRANHDFNCEGFAVILLKSLARSHSILGAEAEVTASVGIAVVHDMQSSFNYLFKKADIAMHKAKQSGKNSYHLYSENLHRDYMRNLNMVNSLKSAISGDLLDLYFQPKINLQNNEVKGVEALLRWNRGNSEGIGPEEFMPIVESTELIHTIGSWVINEACWCCKKWHDAGQLLTVAVNVSAIQLTRSNFYQTVVDALENSQLPAAYLELEITEHSLLQEAPLVTMQLELVKKLGVSLTIDDFGTGYSNM